MGPARPDREGGKARAVADAAAGSSLLRAAGVGAVFSAVFLLTGSDALSPWYWVSTGAISPALVWKFMPQIVPALLIIAAYRASARTERRLGIRQQQGALAVLVFLAVPFPASVPFSGIYGVALLLLAIRTRQTYTVVVGVLALVAWTGVSRLGADWPSLPILVLMAIAAFIAAHRVQAAPREAVAHRRQKP